MNKFAKIALGVVAVSALAASFAAAACHTHTYSEDWTSDATHHWHASTCGHEEVDAKAEHQFNDSGVCSCGYVSADVVTNVGEYHYTSYGHEYGVKVSATTYNGKILDLAIVDSDYVQLSDANPDYGWTDANRQVYLDGEAALVAKFEGKTVSDILNIEVECNDAGVPSTVSDSNYVITGATQSCGRLILAVQNAIAPAEVKTGEYHYTSYGHEYGVKVNVTVKAGRIDKVEIADSDYIQLSDANPDYGWTDEMRQVYIDGEADFLASFECKTVQDVLSIGVMTNEAGVPSGVYGCEDVITGATQSCGRIILAMQNAILGEHTFEGEYHYTSYGHEYGVKVNVTINGMQISKVEIAPSDYVQLSDANPDYGWTDADRQVYLDGEADYLASFEGVNFSTIMMTEVSLNGEVPSAVEGYDVIAGATQSCGRIILAVQDAVEAYIDYVNDIYFPDAE